MADSDSDSDSDPYKRRRKLHVVMVPWLAFGHIIPFYELSKSIAQRGHKITFVSTPRNIARLPKLPDHFLSSITLLKIQLPKVHGLPGNAEATMDLRAEDIQFLKAAYDGFSVEVGRFLEGSGADVVICDFATHLLPPVAKKLGMYCVFFCIFNAWFFAFLGDTEALINGIAGRKKPEDFVVPPEWIPFPTKIGYKLHEARWVVEEAAKTNASGVSDTYRGGKVVESSDLIVVRHCNEFEPEWLNLLAKLHRKRVIPLGLMPPPVQETGNDQDEPWREWLSKQNKESVLYVALGSEVMLSREQLHELAHGLEMSELPFLWAMRKPVGSDSIELPNGFEERNKGKGLVWKQWAPQLRILGHDSVGAFLTHCGWSSVVEGLMFGRPLVLLPFLIDQGLNARMMAEKELGLEVDREEDGSYSRIAVAETIRAVMLSDGGNEGGRLKENARAARGVFGDRELHQQYVEEFMEFMEKQAV